MQGIIEVATIVTIEATLRNGIQILEEDMKTDTTMGQETTLPTENHEMTEPTTDQEITGAMTDQQIAHLIVVPVG